MKMFWLGVVLGCIVSGIVAGAFWAASAYQRYEKKVAFAEQVGPADWYLYAQSIEHKKHPEDNPQKALEVYKTAALEGFEPAIERVIKVYAKGELGQSVSETERLRWEGMLKK